jgi:S1-C subfamily serine protease
VADSRHLQLMVARKPPGSQVSIRIVRDGKDQTLTVQLGELPPQSPLQAEAPESEEN